MPTGPGQPAERAATALRPLRRMLRENHQRGGYVKDLGKVVSMGDRRVRTVFATAKAGDAFDKVKSLAAGLYDEALAGLSADERAALIAMP